MLIQVKHSLLRQLSVAVGCAEFEVKAVKCELISRWINHGERVSAQREGGNFREILLVHNLILRVRMVLPHEEFVEECSRLDTCDFAEEGIVVLMLCNVSRERLNILKAELLSLSGVFDVLRCSLDSLVIIWHNVVHMLIKDGLLFLLRKMKEALNLFLERPWQTLVRRILGGGSR